MSNRRHKTRQSETQDRKKPKACCESVRFFVLFCFLCCVACRAWLLVPFAILLAYFTSPFICPHLVCTSSFRAGPRWCSSVRRDRLVSLFLSEKRPGLLIIVSRKRGNTVAIKQADTSTSICMCLCVCLHPFTIATMLLPAGKYRQCIKLVAYCLKSRAT